MSMRVNFAEGALSRRPWSAPPRKNLVASRPPGRLNGAIVGASEAPRGHREQKEEYMGIVTAREKILERSEMAARAEALRAQGKRIVFSNGCFDLIHVGHLRYLWAARQKGDCLIVAVNSDESMRRIKGPERPILDAEHRKIVLAAFSCVDYVVEFDEDTPCNLLREIHPDILVKGATYSIEGVVGREIVEEYGGKIMTLELTEGNSTTDIIGRVLDAHAQ
jgi:D-beta-D-heptose 7-phosphate kinase/D-beta-D-heptose 1-phosphate adenosyltransferase